MIALTCTATGVHCQLGCIPSSIIEHSSRGQLKTYADMVGGEMLSCAGFQGQCPLAFFRCCPCIIRNPSVVDCSSVIKTRRLAIRKIISYSNHSIVVLYKVPLTLVVLRM